VAGPHADEDGIGAQRCGFFDQHLARFPFALHGLNGEAASGQRLGELLRHFHDTLQRCTQARFAVLEQIEVPELVGHGNVQRGHQAGAARLWPLTPCERLQRELGLGRAVESDDDPRRLPFRRMHLARHAH
jgi:hypothetical protein